MKFTFCIYALLFAFPVGVSVLWCEDTVVFLAAIAASGAAVITGVLTVTFTHRKRRRLAVVIAGTLVCLAGNFSVAVSSWPLRLAFLASRPALEQAASEVRTGASFTDRRVGLFFVRRAELEGTVACLWIDTNPAGRTGFVQTSPDFLPFNLWSAISLDERWQLISED